MGKVFVLGSGFSRAISNEMPTLKDLSELVKANLHASGKPDIPQASSPIANDFEQWLSYLIESPPWLSQAERLRNHGAFADVSRALHDVLDERETAVRTHANCPEWLAQLVQYWHRNQCWVITFNYDLLVEAAWCENVDYPSKSASHLYPVPLTYLSTRTAGIVVTAGPAPPGMRLLKLHGSLNWRYSGPDSPPGDIIYLSGIPTRWELDPPRERDYTLSIDRDPMIVPPAAVKSPYYNNRTLQALWSLAATALQESDELVIMGFSLPESDLIVSSMLATNFEINDESKVVPVNSSDEIITRVLKTFGLKHDDDDDVVDEHVITQYAGKEGDPLPKWVRTFAN